jgi:N-methylhydantoinase B
MDPVTFQVIISRLSGIVQEMQDSIFRTGYSTIVRETQDAGCMLFDAAGNVVGEHAILPLHVAALPEVVRAVRAAFEDIAPGDAFICNHPYAGVTHSSDMAVLTPVFADGALLAFCGSIAHKSDLGGVVPGTTYGGAREVFQEGILFPPVRFVAAGRTQSGIEAILRANSRTPDLILGDLRGQVGVARLGERRLETLIARYGADALREAFARVQDVAEQRVRAALRDWADGVSEAESIVDTDGVLTDAPVRYRVRIEKRGDRIAFDFSGSDDQSAGPLNIRPPLVRGCCYYALLAMTDPTLPNNGGIARVVEATLRPGSILDPHFPAPTNSYMSSTTAVLEAVLDALGAFVPARRIARTGGIGGVTISGRTAAGAAFVQYESVGSAYGARADRDGISGISVLLANTRTAPIEILESEFPTRIARFDLVPDSGGAGTFRGGLSMRREYEILADDAQLTVRGGRHVQPALGSAGGGPGGLGSCIVNPDSSDARVLSSMFSGVRLGHGDRVRIIKSGGGGLGDPALRDRALLTDDIDDGYVSAAAAATVYARPAAVS